MKLYHGTSPNVARLALRDGLKPRRLTKSHNWAHSSPSHPNGVYLTDVYAPYFAVTTGCDVDRRCAIVEVETDRLNPFQLVPDEDALEQTSRAVNTPRPGEIWAPVEWPMRKRTLYYRRHLERYADGENWQKSLAAMGTCAHLGVIPPEAITRVAILHIGDHPHISWPAMDAQISVLNYRFCADKYRQLTADFMSVGEILEREPA